MRSVARVTTLAFAMLLVLGTASIHYSDSSNLSCGAPPTVSVKDTTAINRRTLSASSGNNQCSVFNDLLPSRYSCGHQVQIDDLVEREIRKIAAKIRQRFISGR